MKASKLWLAIGICLVCLLGNVPGLLQLHAGGLTQAKSAPAVIRGPYLQTGTPTSVIVHWRTDLSTETILKYGLSPSNLSQIINLGCCTTEHEVQISGLLPSTTYYYELQNANGAYPNQTNQYFTTSPVTGTRQPVRAWFLGDCGTANNDQRDVRDAYYNYAQNKHTDMVVFLGDNAYNTGTDAEYQNALFENMYEDILKQTVSWSTLGNHDGTSADAATQTGPYFDIFNFPTNGEAGGVASGTEAYYSFNYANIHFIVLESNETDRSVGGTMYNWCETDLQNTTADWIVAIWHHPPYTQGSHNSDIELQLFQMRQNFLPLLEDYGVDLVMCGHSHSYERSYFLNGHYGLSLTFNSNNHTVGPYGYGDGREDGQGAYVKETTGSTAGKGAVYITAGSSGKTSGGLLSHPAMYTSLNKLGSCVLEVNRDTMRVKFLRENGVFDDHFTIIKNDVIPPEITVTNQPANATLTCGQNTSPTALGSLQATSSCSTGSTVVISHNDVPSTGSCANNYYITRTWFATDLCGNQLSYIQTIVIQDTVPPTLTCPTAVDTIYLADTTKYLPDYASQAYSYDFCTNSPAITQMPAAGAVLSLGNQNILLSTADACGNADSCWISLVVLDTMSNGIAQSWIQAIQVYPNPTTGIVHLNIPNGKQVTLQLMDLEGQVLESRQAGSGKVEFDGHQPGMYLLRLQYGKQEKIVKLLVL